MKYNTILKFMIKDKITSEIKNKFREALDRTEKTGKEHSILMCKDKKGNLYSKDICEGEECKVMIENPVLCSPDKAQGNFHTHADIAVARNFLKPQIGQYIPKEFLANFVKDVAEFEGNEITTPSYGDVINALVNKCFNRTEGTVCIGSEALPERVDCWTVNNTITKSDCNIATMIRIKGVGIGPPEPWIKPLFDKEKIDLNK